MELLSNHMNTKVFCDRIIISKYQQSTDNTVKETLYPNLIELLFTHYDHHFAMVDSKDKELYVKQRLVELASQLEEDAQNSYTKFNYNKQMNISTIQHGLQSMNHVSALLYLSDLYKITIVIYLEGQCKVITSDKTRLLLHIVYTKEGKWFMTETPPDYKLSDFNQLSECLVCDVKSKDIYNRYLNPISKYKSSELIELATQRNIG